MDIHYSGNSCTPVITIEKFRDSFASHGLPDTFVSDNGPCFVSLKFQELCRAEVLGMCAQSLIIPPLTALQRENSTVVL